MEEPQVLPEAQWDVPLHHETGRHESVSTENIQPTNLGISKKHTWAPVFLPKTLVM